MDQIEANDCTNVAVQGSFGGVTQALEIPIDLARVPTPRPAETLSTAELADCTCPDWCERDHDRD